MKIQKKAETAMSDKLAEHLGVEKEASPVNTVGEALEALGIPEAAAPVQNYVYEIPSIHEGKFHVSIAPSAEEAVKLTAMHCTDLKCPAGDHSEEERKKFYQYQFAVYTHRGPIQRDKSSEPAQFVGRNLPLDEEEQQLQ